MKFGNDKAGQHMAIMTVLLVVVVLWNLFA
jgi:hypothetical protein